MTWEILATVSLKFKNFKLYASNGLTRGWFEEAPGFPAKSVSSYTYSRVLCKFVHLPNNGYRFGPIGSKCPFSCPKEGPPSVTATSAILV